VVIFNLSEAGENILTSDVLPKFEQIIKLLSIRLNDEPDAGTLLLREIVVIKIIF